MLRALRIDMFWDNAEKPAVSVPLGDFFGIGLGRTTSFQNAIFASPEGRSFNCFIPMPFKKSAKIVVTNESAKTLNLLFFDVDYSLVKELDAQAMYFHAFWRRDTATMLAEDYELLPNLNGKGRFLGVNIGVNANPRYGNSWFGEGEVKIYLDGDTSLPTLNGTGTEDYIGTGWGQGKFIQQYSGCSVSDDSLKQWAFYRYHIPDPVFFQSNCRVTIQAIGGDTKKNVAAYLRSGAPLLPVSTANEQGFYPYYKKDSLVNLDDSNAIDGWTNFYRSDDFSSTAYFYLDQPVNDLPALSPVSVRIANLKNNH
nr:glycoside hydrolase family 172 protein [Flavihumibacter profundi]